MTTGYDVIGDVHGSIAKLEGLLSKMGYRPSADDGTWRHPERTAVFVGDLVDRGPGQRRTIELVRSMVEAGSALITMGNHEFNAIGYATLRDEHGDEHLRKRNAKHFGQHEVFLTEYAVDSDDHRDVISWFRTLPLWLELPGLRVVHACWSNPHIETLRIAHGGDRLPDDHEALVRCFDEGNTTYDAIEVVLKGPEVTLTEPHHYLDKDGHPRGKGRYTWWGSGGHTLRERAVFVPDSRRLDGSAHPGFDDTPITDAVAVPYTDDVPVIVGHYWFTGQPTTQSGLMACVDFSAVKGGPLVAYRFDGEARLSNDKLVSFP